MGFARGGGVPASNKDRNYGGRARIHQTLRRSGQSVIGVVGSGTPIGANRTSFAGLHRHKRRVPATRLPKKPKRSNLFTGLRRSNSRGGGFPSG